MVIFDPKNVSVLVPYAKISFCGGLGVQDCPWNLIFLLKLLLLKSFRNFFIDFSINLVAQPRCRVVCWSSDRTTASVMAKQVPPTVRELVGTVQCTECTVLYLVH